MFLQLVTSCNCLCDKTEHQSKLLLYYLVKIFFKAAFSMLTFTLDVWLERRWKLYCWLLVPPVHLSLQGGILSSESGQKSREICRIFPRDHSDANVGCSVSTLGVWEWRSPGMQRRQRSNPDVIIIPFCHCIACINTNPITIDLNWGLRKI